MIEFCTSLVLSKNDKDLIKKSLPEQWETEVLHFYPEKHKEIHIKINAQTIEDTQEWLEAFQKLTNTFYSIYSGYNSKGQKVYYKKRYHCHHNTRHKDTFHSVTRTSIKNTKCPSIMIISIRKIIERYQGKNRPADPDKPCEIKIKLEHNHSIDDPNILKFNKVLPEVKEQLQQLFAEGYNASTALRKLKETIKSNNENYKKIFADRSRCPAYGYCYYLFLKYQNISSLESDEKYLTNLFEKYNVDTNEISAEMAVCEDGTVVCLCPPIARRVHQHEYCGKIVFVDSFASLDQNGNRIFLFLTPSEVGCLPLGIIIMSNENSIMVRIGLSLLKEMLGEYAFYGDLSGPEIFITDEFLIEDCILTSVWPKSTNFLSIFHVVQNIWHWLSNSSNNISLEDRPVLFKDFYNVLYAQTELNFNSSFSLAVSSAQKYQNYLNLLNNYYGKKEFWALYLRPDILKSENEIIKYSESTIRFLRSNMFAELKNFEFIPMIEYIINNFYPYFEKRLLDVSSDSIPDVFFSKKKQVSSETLNKIQILGANMRLVPSKASPGTYYMINIDLLTCTCANANSSSICKHVQCVSMSLYQKVFEENCQNLEIKKKCYFLATGNDLHEETDGATENLDEGTVKTFEEYLQQNPEEEILLARKEESRQECEEIWQNIKSVFESFVESSANDFSPVLDKIASKFEAIDCVSDLRAAFNIFDSVKKKQKKTVMENEETHDDEENAV